MKAIFALVLLLAASAAAQSEAPKGKKNPPTVSGAPISDKILSAKMVYLLVGTKKQESNYKNAYKYLAEWDRWKIINDPKQADIVLRITDGADGTVGFGSGSATTTGGYTQGSGMVLGISLSHFYLAVLDSDGTMLWGTDTDQRVASSQNTQRMLKTLRKRISEIEKTKINQQKVQ